MVAAGFAPAVGRAHISKGLSSEYYNKRGFDSPASEGLPGGNCGADRAIRRVRISQHDRAAVDRFVDLVGDTLAPVARLKTIPGGRFGRHLVAEMKFPGRRKSGQILALGHTDTVWPLGTLCTMPFRRFRGQRSGDRACWI